MSIFKQNIFPNCVGKYTLQLCLHRLLIIFLQILEYRIQKQQV